MHHNSNIRFIKRILRGLPIILAALLLVSCGKKADSKELDYRDEGLAYMAEGDYEAALKSFQKALDCTDEIGEVEIDICMYKALTLYKSGDFDGAREVYDALIDYKKYPEAYYQRGNLSLFMGDYEGAVADFDAAIDEAPKNYEIYIGVYNSLNNYNHPEEAVGYLRAAQDISGEKANDHYYKGRIALLLGNREEAVKLLELAVEQGKGEANFYLSEIYRKDGDEEKTASYLNAYMEGENVDADALVSTGEAELSEGKYAQALIFFEAAKSLGNATNAQKLERLLAIAYEKTGDFDRAYETMKEYVASYPNDYKAQDELVFLETRIK